MKIKKYIKCGKNKYKIILENDEIIILHENIILKNELLLKKEIIDLDLIIKENEKYELYDKILGYINKRIRCEKEIRDYLEKRTADLGYIDEIINKLYENKLLNNDLYIKSYLHDKINFTNDGPIKIKQNLLDLGFNNYLIDDLLVEFNDKLIHEKITNYIEKNLKINKKSLISFKQKMLVNLINLGYDKEDIINVLDKVYFDDQNILLKEKEKLLKKYSKKYQGKELDYFIKKKLYEKGFKNNI